MIGGNKLKFSNLDFETHPQVYVEKSPRPLKVVAKLWCSNMNRSEDSCVVCALLGPYFLGETWHRGGVPLVSHDTKVNKKSKALKIECLTFFWIPQLVSWSWIDLSQLGRFLDNYPREVEHSPWKMVVGRLLEDYFPIVLGRQLFRGYVKLQGCINTWCIFFQGTTYLEDRLV